MEIFLSIYELCLLHSFSCKNSQGVRNPWLKDVFVWKQHTTDHEKPKAVHQYNLGRTNTDFKMFCIQTNFGISTARMFYADNVLTV